MFGVILDRNRPRKVVFYGRVSTEHEAQLSALENQMQWYDDIARRFSNWEVVDKYIDEGITGTQARKRPAFIQMIEDSKTGKFDLIVTREVCRFARNTVDTLTHTRELKGRNIEVYFVDDNIWTMDGDGELRLTIMATLAQEESRKVSERVRAGQHISRSKNILYGCGNILGYDLKRNIGEDGKWDPSENTYVINPEQAETVRMIYDLYEKGYGLCKIRNCLIENHRLTATGTSRWEVQNISRILDNATYKGCICYNKSGSNNYLEQKRIVNRNKDTYEYHKGDWEPIISEEQWDRVQQIRRSKTRVTTSHAGETEKISRRPSSCIWVNKLRCACGSCFRKNRYHKANDGTLTYNFVCYNQVRYGKASERAKKGADTEGFCNEPSITDWKMELMAKTFIDQVWQTRKDDLISLSEEIQAFYKEDYRNDTEKNLMFIDEQIEKTKKKIKNLLDLLAEGGISKEDYAEMRRTYDEELKDMDEQKLSFENQYEKHSHTMEDLAGVSKALAGLIDLSDDDLRAQLLEKFLVSVVADNGKYYWHYRLNTNTKMYGSFSVSGRKNKPSVSLEIMKEKEEASDEDASDIHNNVSLEDSETNVNTSSELHPPIPLLHRLLSLKASNSDKDYLTCANA